MYIKSSMQKETENKSKLVPVLVVGIIMLSFATGSLWQKVKSLEKGTPVPATGTAQAPTENYLSIENLKKYAKDLKLDSKKFDNCLDTGAKTAQVGKEQKEGESEGISGTPGFFLNGHLIGGAIPFEMFKTLIDFEQSSGFDKTTTYPDEVKKLVDQGVVRSEKTQVVSAGYPSKGPANAKITLVEYSDFECPYCARAYPTVKKVLETYPDTVKLVYKQFPLTSIHTNAQKAAEASLCALEQNKFWEYHDKLFGSAPG